MHAWGLRGQHAARAHVGSDRNPWPSTAGSRYTSRGTSATHGGHNFCSHLVSASHYTEGSVEKGPLQRWLKMKLIDDPQAVFIF